MRLILLCHPPALGSASMPRFARFVGNGMAGRGHAVEYLTSSSKFSALAGISGTARKWMGYIDQYLVFPPQLRKKLAQAQKDTLVAVTDHALGMWIPAASSYPHAVHCHDFLAQRSSLGEFPENPTGPTGRYYQKLIRNGYRKGRNFISVSNKTKEDLHNFLPAPPRRSEVLYNGLNYPFSPQDRAAAMGKLADFLPGTAKDGFILHVGGNQWYKNRSGVLAIHREYCRNEASPLPLVMIGPEPGATLRAQAAEQGGTGAVHFLTKLSDAELHAAYCAAAVFLFPSLEEGFGWPIAEAQACGCPVLTTGHAPMTEVGGNAAHYLPRKPSGSGSDSAAWAAEAARTLAQILALSPAARAGIVSTGVANAARFEPEKILDRLEQLYSGIISDP